MGGGKCLVAVFEEFKLGSPFHLISGQEKTPYTAKVTAILDHSLSGGYYGVRDNKIVAYNGAIADLSEKCYPITNGCLYGYQTADSKTDPENYHILPELNYDDSWLWYDDHSGYDYSMPLNTNLYATIGGKLRKAASNPVVGNEDWDHYHAIYIDHGNGYSSWYLHCDSLDAALEQEIDQGGYVEVTKGQLIGKSGDYGANGQEHLHFELQYKDVNGQSSMMDPYQFHLWDASPQ
jgi:murein DD-endopeptidase MepM/ murein hydrolase activator NlpD